MDGGQVRKENILAWKEKLQATHSPASINSMLAAVNGFFDWLQLPELKVNPGIRIEIYYCGSSEDGPCGSGLQGQNPYCPAAFRAGPCPWPLLQQSGDWEGNDFLYKKREAAGSVEYMERDEEPLRKGKGGAGQGISP